MKTNRPQIDARVYSFTAAIQPLKVIAVYVLHYFDEYKAHAAQKAEIRKTNEHINQLKKKNPADLTPDEIELIKNQNDIMRFEIQKRDEKISSLSRKLGAKFVPFEIFSEDKLQYVAAELRLPKRTV